jgi:hypothetical protein
MKDGLCRLSRKGKIRNYYSILVRKSDWKRQLGRPESKWNDATCAAIKATPCQFIDVDVCAGFVWLWISTKLDWVDLN